MNYLLLQSNKGAAGKHEVLLWLSLVLFLILVFVTKWSVKQLRQYFSTHTIKFWPFNKA